MNNKGWVGVLGVFLIIIVLIGAFIGVIALISIPFLSSGQSTDIAYGLEQSSFWGKLYLKDDHKTVYCIEKDSNLMKIADEASINKLKVKVTYQEYVFKGFLCGLFNDKYDAVVVKDIEVLR